MSGGQIIYGLVVAGAVATPIVFAAAWRTLKARRRLLRFAIPLLTIPYLAIVYAFMIEPKTLEVRHVSVASAHWTGPPLRIGVITDLHIGGVHVPPARVVQVVTRMNAERPDVVVLLGDYVDGHVWADHRHPNERAAIEEGILALRGLKAPGGVAAVIGNHDVLYDVDEVRRALAAAGANVLENVSMPVRGGAIVGLGELSSDNAHYAQAAATAPPQTPLIVAMHWPDSITGIDTRAALVLAGHSHCGQMGLPVIDQLVVASPASRLYRCGLYEVGGKPLYVSGGVGTSILPMRFLAPPEIGVVTLSAR
jgi:predicted MPP superfamily phosphohydrolase